MPASAADAQPLRALTYNIQGNLNEDISMSSIAGVISGQNADVVGLQEACANQVDDLQNRLPAYPYARHVVTVPMAKAHCVDYGIAILSKLPLADYTATQLPTHNEKRFVQSATITAGGLPVRFYNTHLSPGAGATHVNAIAAETDKPAPERKIVVGDLNVEQDDGALNALWARSFVEADWSGNTPTHPSGSPSKKIDFVFLGGAVAGGPTAVPNTTASDHRPLRADVELIIPPPRTPTRIVYESGGDIYRVAPDGTNRRQLTTHAASDSDPVASPDGSQIAFVSSRSGNLDLWVMDADGEATSLRQLTTNGAEDREPTWSPDGAWIAFRTTRHVNGDNNNELYKLRVSDRAETRLTNNASFSEFNPDWSPAGGLIAYQRYSGSTNNEVFTMSETGASATNRTNNSANDGRPSFSPDGTQLAFHSNRNAVSYELFTVRLSDNALVRRVANPREDQAPAWSPDGSQLVFQSDRASTNDLFTGDITAGLLTSGRRVTTTGAVSGDWYRDTRPPNTTSLDGPASPTRSPTPAFTFARDEAEGSFDCRVDGGAWSTCSSPYTPAPLSDGSRTIEVRAVDWAGNVDATPRSRTLVVDTVEPATQIDAAPPALGSDTTPRVEISASEDATFECSVDEAPFTSCTSPADLGPLSDGPHRFQARAIDTAGNTDTSPARADFIVDTTPPETSLDAAPDALTSDGSPVVEFSSDAGATFTCALDGATATACSSPLQLDPLDDGPHTLVVTATDAAGNVEAAGAVVSFTVDTTKPVAQFDAGPGARTKDATPSFAFSAGEDVTWTCSVDGGGFSACSSPHELASLDDGPHTFAIRATDAAGNVAAGDASASFTVDTEPPPTQIDAAPPALGTDATPTVSFSGAGAASFECSVDGGAFASCASPLTLPSLSDGSHTFDVRAIDDVGNADATPAHAAFVVDTTPPDTVIDAAPGALTNDPTPTVTFSAEAGSSFTCSVDGGSASACSSPHTLAALDDGSHTLEIVATDAAGHVEASGASASFTVDTTRPVTTFSAAPPPRTNDDTPSFAFVAEDGATYECALGSGAFTACSSPHALGPLSDGSYTLAVRATDRAANVEADPVEATVVVDTAKPVTSFTTTPAAIGNDPSPAVAFGASEGDVTFSCTLDDEPVDCAAPWTTLGDGDHVFAVRATDAAGNLEAAAATASFTIDTAAPPVQVDAAPPALGNDPTPTIAFSSTDPGATFTCALDGAAASGCVSPLTLDALDDDAHELVIRARDAAGNTSAGTPVAFTTDTAAPRTTFGSGPTGATDDTSPSFTFGASESGATFRCSVDRGALKPCTSPLVAGPLSPGAHTVHVEATDAAGNVEATPAERAFSVNFPPPVVRNPPAPPAPPKSFVVGFDEYKSAPGSSSASTSPAIALVTRSAKPDRRGRVKLVLACRTACRGRLVIGKAKTTFNAKAGRRVTVTLTLDRATRAELRKARRTLSVTVRFAGGTASLTLRRPAVGRR